MLDHGNGILVIWDGGIHCYPWDDTGHAILVEFTATWTITLQIGREHCVCTHRNTVIYHLWQSSRPNSTKGR